MKKNQMLVSTAALEHAEWNPRTEAELMPDHPEMKKLIASVRELGVVQPIAVWDCPASDGPMIVIAGNRRFAAAREIGLKEIPAIVFTDLSVAQAQEITRVENEVRLGVDPVKDAALIGSMLGLGYEQKEIAAHFGVSEATVCRRAKLLDLVPEMRELALDGGISTDALERIALYPPEVQKACMRKVREVSKRAVADGASARWAMLYWDFNSQTKDLDDAKFDTDECAACPKRSGAQPDLWGDIGDGKLGKCLDRDCFAAHYENFVVALVRAKVGDGVDLVKIEDAPITMWEMKDNPQWNEFFGEKRTKKHCVAYWNYCDWNGELEFVWGVPLADVEAEIARRREDEESEKAANAEKERANSERYNAIKAERERIAAERKPFVDAKDEAIESLCDDVNDSSNDDIIAAVKKSLVVKSKVSQIVAAAVVAGFDDYSFGNDYENWAIEICEAVPAFAKALKVKPKLIKDARKAVDALAKFDKANPMSEFDK